MITLVGWKETKETLATLNSIKSFVEKEIGFNTSIVDAYRTTVEGEFYYIYFGEDAKNYSEHKEAKGLWTMPTVKKLSKDRKNNIVVLKKILTEIKEKTEKPVQVYTETEDGITLGKEACNINITEQEVQYLKSLRDLLQGSKMIISKGDIKIEVQ